MEKIKLFRELAKRFPKSIKSRGDRIGLMTGKLPDNINHILLCLDFDEIVLEMVRKMDKKPDLILTHHPFIYGPRQTVLKHNDTKRRVCEEIDKLGIPVYSMHTNFDTGKGGMNDALSKALGLKNVYAPEKEIMMRIGELESEMDAVEFAKLAKQVFHVDYALLINSGSKNVKKVGIIGGGGSRDWRIAKDEGCDIYISGDAPHHVRRDIVNAKYNYLDTPHEIEKIFMPTMKEILLSYDSTLIIEAVDHEKLPRVIQSLTILL